MAEDDSKWIRECSMFEQIMEHTHQRGFLITSYSMTLNSVKPLQEYHIQRAFLHLLRKVPTLSVCLRQRDEKMWFRQMEHERVDFKILKNVNFEDEFHAMSEHHYDTFEGPLWCSRLLPCSLNEKCAMPAIKEKYQNQYILLFGIHHAITDGHSTMHICKYFLEILNDVIAGKPINDHEKFGYHSTDEHTAKEIQAVAPQFLSNPDEMARVRAISDPKEDVLFLKAYPPPSSAKARTLSLARNLSEEDTSSLLKKCKSEGVSIHSAITTAINATVIDLLIQAGQEHHSYDIPSFHVLNNRRFWTDVEDTSKAFGCHIGHMAMISNCSQDIKEDFWNHAREFNKIFKKNIEEKLMWKQILMMMAESEKNKDADFLSQITQSIPKSCFTTTNMGNLSHLLPGTGEHVQITDFRRTTSTRGTICSHVLQTFRGRFLYSIDYDTSFMTKQTANLYADTFIEIVKNSFT